MPFLFLSSVFHAHESIAAGWVLLLQSFGLFSRLQRHEQPGKWWPPQYNQQCVGGGPTAFSRATHCTELLEVGRLLHACVLVVRVCACVWPQHPGGFPGHLLACVAVHTPLSLGS